MATIGTATTTATKLEPRSISGLTFLAPRSCKRREKGQQPNGEISDLHSGEKRHAPPTIIA